MSGDGKCPLVPWVSAMGEPAREDTPESEAALAVEGFPGGRSATTS